MKKKDFEVSDYTDIMLCTGNESRTRMGTASRGIAQGIGFEPIKVHITLTIIC